jgi:hypothetical protein
MGVPESESLVELHMAAANGSMDRILADVKAPSREAEPENAPVPGWGSKVRIYCSQPQMTRGTVGPSRFSRRVSGGGTKLRVGLEQTEIDGEGVPRSDRWHQNGPGRVQKGL